MNTITQEDFQSKHLWPVRISAHSLQSVRHCIFHCLHLSPSDSGFAEVKVDSFDINDNPPNLNKSPLYLRPGKNYILIR